MKRQTRPFTVEIRGGGKRRPAPEFNAAPAVRSTFTALSMPMPPEERPTLPVRAEAGDRRPAYETALSEADRVFGGPALRPSGPAHAARDAAAEAPQPRILPDLVSAAHEEARQRAELEMVAAARREARGSRPERAEAAADVAERDEEEGWPDDADVAVRRARPARTARPAHRDVREEAAAPVLDAPVGTVEAEAAPRPARRRNPSAPLARSERWKQRRLPKACW